MTKRLVTQTPPQFPGAINSLRSKGTYWWNDRSRLIKIARRISLGGLFGGASLCAILYFDGQSKVRELDKSIWYGNCDKDPSVDVSVGSYVVDRSDIVEMITKSFIYDRGNGFGVVLGPTGTGKTFAIRQACFRTRKGTLYFEIGNVHGFPELLAKAIGMRTEPSMIGVMLGKYLPPSLHGYYNLPSDYSKSIGFVIDNLAQRAKVFKKKTGYSPCLFIDGADLLAKYNPNVFVDLVNLAKRYANEGGLRIIFGCSEGHIIPLIYTATSSTSRCEILEILDLEENDAIDYLINRRLDKEFAVRLVKSIGSRIIFLERGVKYYYRYKLNCMNEEDLFKKVVDRLEVLFTERGLDTIVEEKPRSIEILRYLMKFDNDGFNRKDFFDEYAKEDKQKAVRKSLDSLVDGNTLRYTMDGKITWHSQLMRKKVKEFLKV